MTAQAGSALPSPLSDRDAIRRDLRRKRRALTLAERSHAARRIAQHLEHLPRIKPGARIAVYVAIQGEIDLHAFIALARRRHCKLYLPRLTNTRRGHMEFFPFGANTRLRANRYGIGEPVANAGPALPPRGLDVVLAPLVAFDAHGGRLGMGAGYYDRRLRFLRDRNAWRRPKLIGVAYEFQRVTHLNPQPWDVPMDGCVTELGYRASYNKN